MGYRLLNFDRNYPALSKVTRMEEIIYLFDFSTTVYFKCYRAHGELAHKDFTFVSDLLQTDYYIS